MQGVNIFIRHMNKKIIYDHILLTLLKNLRTDNLQECIERFLGNDLVNHPLVLNLKLDVNERQRFDQEISREELDIALDGASCKSAAGIDGISSKFMKRYWEFFRDPL